MYRPGTGQPSRSRTLRRPAPFALPVFLLVAGPLVAGLLGAGQQRASAWRQAAITIDAWEEEWVDRTAGVPGERLALGMMNDDDSLYVCVIAREPAVRDQLALRGLTVWLDPFGTNRKRSFGVRLPIGEDGQPDGIEILKSGQGIVERLGTDGGGGIEARMGVHDAVFVLELKVPLAPSGLRQHAVNAKPGDDLDVGIEAGPDLTPRGRPVGGSVGGRWNTRGGYGWSAGVAGSVGGGDGRVNMTTTVRLARPPAGASPR